MLISCALFAGATYAWFFDDNCSASVATVTTADYFGVNVVKGSESESEQDTKMLPTSGAYNLSAGKYTVTLTWVGKGAAKGYYIIGIGDENKENVQYYSPNLTAETTTVSFQLVIAESSSATLTPVWKDNAGGVEVTTIDSETPISYPAVPQSYAMRAGSDVTVPSEPEGTPEPETGGNDNDTDDPTQTGTNNSAGENSETGEGSTGNGNSTGGEPSGSGSSGNEGGENGEGGSTVEDTTGSDTGNVPSGVE